MSNFNKPASQETYNKLDGDLTRPDNTEPSVGEAPVPVRSELWGEFLLTVYRYKDGSEGFAITNGKAAIHMDNTNNIIMSAGAPGQSGCGGKLVMNTGDSIQKSSAVAIEVSGKANGGVTDTQENSDGNIEETTEPPYSLKVYGDILVEAVGGDIKYKGSNVTVKADNTLNLTSGKDINIQAGGTGGNVNISAGNLKIDAAFLDKKISGGEYTDGAGEVKTDQLKPGSSVVINTAGDVTNVANGNVEFGSLKDLRIGGKNIELASLFDLGIQSKTMSTLVFGKSKLEVQGLADPESTQTEHYSIVVGPVEKPLLKGLKIDSLSGMELNTLKNGFNVNVGKALSSLDLNEKTANLTVLKEFSLNMDPKAKEVSLAATKVSKISLSPEKASITAPAIFLN